MLGLWWRLLFRSTTHFPCVAREKRKAPNLSIGGLGGRWTEFQQIPVVETFFRLLRTRRLAPVP
jgi:hypothetical protein